MNNNFFGKVKSSIQKRSFYLVLMVCVIAITITAVYVTKARLNYLSENTLVEEDSNYNVSIFDNGEEAEEENTFDFLEDEKENESGEEEKENNTQETLIQLNDNADSTQEKVEEDIKPQTELKTESKQENLETVNQKPQKKFSIENISMPVEGKIIKEFSIDKLLYSKTLDQWCTHNGVDIGSPAGTPVKAVGDGIIEGIYTDDMLGITIEISHGNGYKTKYSNLSSADMVQKDEFVKEGQTISGIGKTSISEKSEENHLHFEIILNNEYIDPHKYLPVSIMH